MKQHTLTSFPQRWARQHGSAPLRRRDEGGIEYAKHRQKFPHDLDFISLDRWVKLVSVLVFVDAPRQSYFFLILAGSPEKETRISRLVRRGWDHAPV